MDLNTTTSPTVDMLKSGKRYFVNEVFYSVQGEGIRAGTPNIFIRFGGCNLACDGKELNQPVCDTEFVSGRKVTLDELAEWVVIAFKQGGGKIWAEWEQPWFILTGGEPGLQVDAEFLDYWRPRGVKFAIETNGTIALPPGLDWITLSPKVAEHAIKQLMAHEVKYVRGYGQGIPRPVAKAEHYLISPAFDGLRVDPRTLEWCVRLVTENPQWRLSIQQHKFLKVR